MNKAVVAVHESAEGTPRSYTIGFGWSLAITIAAYLAVVSQHIHGAVLLAVLAVLGIAQLIIQLVYFLHLTRESKPRWNLIAFLFALMVVIIIVFGSLWIMQNLNYNHHGGMPSNASSQSIMNSERIPK